MIVVIFHCNVELWDICSRIENLITPRAPNTTHAIQEFFVHYTPIQPHHQIVSCLVSNCTSSHVVNCTLHIMTNTGVLIYRTVTLDTKDCSQIIVCC